MKNEKYHTVRIGLRYNRKNFIKMVEDAINRTSDAYSIETPSFSAANVIIVTVFDRLRSHKVVVPVFCSHWNKVLKDDINLQETTCLSVLEAFSASQKIVNNSYIFIL